MRLRETLRLPAACLLFISIACQTHAPPLPPPASVETLRRDVSYLASDELDGRGVGTDGLDAAADYIAARFQSLRLQPLPGCPDYFQRFTMRAAASVDPKTALSIAGRDFKLASEFTPTSFSTEGDFTGGVVFAGYGISSKEHDYDDYADTDVAGKVVLVLRYEPHDPDGTSQFGDGDWSPDASLSTKAQLAAARGAAAILLVNPPRFHEGEGLFPISRGGPKSTIPFIHVTPQVADGLLKTSGSTRSLQSLQDQIDRNLKPQSFPLNLEIRGSVAIERKPIDVKNVLAVLPGTTHADEFVVVGAHYDHLGRGGTSSLSPNSGDVHNGADDNASGTVAIMHLAEQLARSGPRQRSIVFVLFTGEEAGLVGSQHFADHPPVKLGQIVAMLNMDMVGRIRNQMLYIGGTGTAARFDNILRDADRRSPLQVKSIGKGGWGPSDHQVFAMKKIPVLFFFSGMHADYHRPTDDADKINFTGIADVVQFAQLVVDSLATMPRQQYVSKYDSQRPMVGSTGPRIGVTLGVVPDYGTDESAIGVRITGTSPGSPAEAAGLLDGDIIVQINERKIENLYDLSDFLARAKPGQKVKILLRRGGQRLELHATLTARTG